MVLSGPEDTLEQFYIGRIGFCYFCQFDKCLNFVMEERIHNYPVIESIPPAV